MTTNSDRYPHDEKAPQRGTAHKEAMELLAEGLVRLGAHMDDTEYEMRMAQYERDSYKAEVMELREAGD